MGFTLGVRLGCHACKRRFVGKGRQLGAAWDAARQAGWVARIWSKHGEFIWLCPTCARKFPDDSLATPPKRENRG